MDHPDPRQVDACHWAIAGSDASDAVRPDVTEDVRQAPTALAAVCAGKSVVPAPAAPAQDAVHPPAQRELYTQDGARSAA